MAFFGLTYCGPQNYWKYHDKEKNDFNVPLEKSIGRDKLTKEMRDGIRFEDDEEQDYVFEDDSATTRLRKAITQKRPAKASHYSAASLREEINVKHARVRNGPRQMWHTPITTSQQVGWAALQAQLDEDLKPAPQKVYPISSSEESRYQEVMIRYNHSC
mmetsp:Transcript_144689/g.204661  ORF Transcript_144689/g.204661 Transcript_144689/m.204661 type:complete len:159 (-) Transcript_144689:52-528(-)